ncbi:hypothetical protein [Hyphococcus luteus]|uniref:DUF485 domain-containing protein n=1 Tax=Hyphococcus luteus TaxID=2058213 RepID=A0A2S7JZH2_9PROT|nr:hypothetical protein [Marinicaulis flavus]PQA85598.1 hypothetical protein CW354_21925 [Marinicaulis flavus]
MTSANDNPQGTTPDKPAGHYRRRAYALWIGALIGVFLLYMIAPVLLPLFDLPPRLLAAPLVFIEIALVLFGLGWLAFYVFGAPRKKDRGAR